MATSVFNRLESPQDLIDYACRKLGAPVINIEIDTTQAEDRIDDAMQMFMQRHYDAVEEVWIKVVFNAGDITRGYKRLDENLVAVIGLIEHSSASLEPAWTDITYQLKYNNMVDIISPDVVNYTLTMQHINLINSLIKPKRSFHFNKYSHQLRVLGNVQANDFVIIQAYKTLNPDFVLDIYNDEWLKRYATALIKRQWGANLKKFEGVQMPGGVTLDGQSIFDEGNGEVESLEEEFSLTYELPVDMFMG